MHLHTCVYACNLCTSLSACVLNLMSFYPFADLSIFHGVLEAEVVAGGLYFFFSHDGHIIPYLGADA